MAAAQTVTCTACTHEVSVYMGDGGFVAKATTGTEMVTYVSHCGGVTSSGQIAANADGLVAMLFSACDATNPRLELGPVMDGGWFWITDEMNSAVGPLVNQSVLDNATTMITSAGSSVTMMAGKGAVFMKEMSTGRVGILPNILPEQPTPGVRPCGYDDLGAGPAATRYVRRATNCALGDGRAVFRVRGPVDPYTGGRAVLEDGATIIRPYTGSVTVLVDLWGNGNGHFTTQATGASANPRRGHLGSGGPPLEVDQFRGTALPTGPGGTTGFTNNAALGLLITTELALGTFTVSPSEAHCGTPASPLHHSVDVYIEPHFLSGQTRLSVTPPVVTGPGLTPRLNLTVACP